MFHLEAKSTLYSPYWALRPASVREVGVAKYRLVAKANGFSVRLQINFAYFTQIGFSDLKTPSAVAILLNRALNFEIAIICVVTEVRQGPFGHLSQIGTKIHSL